MNSSRYIIIDEKNKIVVGYVEDNNIVKYIAYTKTESCSVNIIKDKQTVINRIKDLQKISDKRGDGHTFKYTEI
jgi:hypothetical protein